MTPASKAAQEAKTTYDRLSTYYDLLTRFGERDLTAYGVEKLQVEEGEKVLEIGFGTGWALIALARAVGRSGRVHGIDISEGMYEVTRRKIGDAGLSDRVDLKRGDARQLPYPENEFDAIFLSFTLELFDTPHLPVVLQECRRVLRERGRICVVALSKDRKLGPVGRLYECLHNRFPSYLDCRPIPVKEVLREAGFQLAHTEARAIWGLPVVIAVAQMGGPPDQNRKRTNV